MSAERVDSDLVTRFLGTQSCAPLVGSLLCRACDGNGQVGIDLGRGGVDSRTCPDCGGSGNQLDDDKIELILADAIKREDIELVVECESALAQVQREETRREHVARVAELVSARRSKEAA